MNSHLVLTQVTAVLARRFIQFTFGEFIRISKQSHDRDRRPRRYSLTKSLLLGLQRQKHSVKYYEGKNNSSATSREKKNTRCKCYSSGLSLIKKRCRFFAKYLYLELKMKNIPSSNLLMIERVHKQKFNTFTII